MKLQFLEIDDIIFIDKPAGLSTHSPDVNKWGAVEVYQKLLGHPLYVVHRLDKTTTGSLLFAKTQTKAQQLTEQFKQHLIKKTYWFVTDRQSEKSDYLVQSKIEKNGKIFISETANITPNSETEFKRIKRSPFFELWEAHPRSGKPHQIRLHAANLGLNILGDTLYGGSAFPHLCLHSLELEVPGLPAWKTPPPRFFERLGLLKDPTLCQLLAALDRRQRHFNFLQDKTATLRLSHGENPQFKLELLGEVLWGLWYSEEMPTKKDLLRMEFLADLLSRKFILRKMNNRGKDPLSKNSWSSDPEPNSSWIANEQDLQFEFHTDKGLSSGLFLDQRQNRQWLKKVSKNKKILNLFSYTGGFSVAAALGQAQSVTTVDISKDFLEWTKRNFHLNNLDPNQFEFFKQDSLLFLEACIKRNRQFDIIICDPPSFGRHKEGIFKLEKDWKKLIDHISKCLVDSGHLLFSHNLESWTDEQFKIDLSTYQSPQTGYKWKILPSPLRDLDFEQPNETPQMKQLLLQKIK